MTTAEDWMKQVPPPRPLCGSDQWNVFLSYRSADRALVCKAFEDLPDFNQP